MFLTWCGKSTRNSFLFHHDERWNEQRIYIFPWIIRGGSFMYQCTRREISAEMSLKVAMMNYYKLCHWDQPMFPLHLFSFNILNLHKICRCKRNFPNILHLCWQLSFSRFHWAHYEFQGKFHKSEMSKKFSIHQTHFISTASE